MKTSPATYWLKFLPGLMVGLLLSVGLTDPAAAQEQKIGYIDSDYILSQMPEYQGIQQTLDRLSQEWREQLDEMNDEIEQMKKEFEAKEVLYTDEVRKQHQQEIQAKIKKREQYREEKFGPKGEYFQRQQELLEPIQRKVLEAVHKVAERQGFDYVFDKSGEVMFMYARAQWNLNDAVLNELGISTENGQSN